MPEQVHGWCIPCRDDVPSAPGRPVCADCGHVLIAPSWSSRLAPYPWPPKPDGFVRKFKLEDAPKRSANGPPRPLVQPRGDARPAAPAPTVEVTCAYCRRTVTVTTRGGSPRRYCGVECRHKAASAMTTRRKRATRPAPITCVVCKKEAPGTSAHGGRRTRFCGPTCRKKHHRANTPRRRMADEGRRCVDCNRDDVYYRADGCCDTCYQRRLARRLRVAG
jgi:hypothetical protein